MMHQRIYSSMVGKHFTEVHIKLLCALIDQRITMQLPNYLLRSKLAAEIQTAIEEQAVVKPMHQEALRRVQRDLEQNSFGTERPCVITCVLENGEQLTLDLKNNRLSWSRIDGEHEIEYKSEPIRNGFVRIITAESAPCVSKRQILSSTNDMLLHSIFQISDEEKALMLKELDHIQQDLQKLNHEIEDMRSTMCQNGTELKLLRPEVLKASQELDRKIVAFMTLQQRVKGGAAAAKI